MYLIFVSKNLKNFFKISIMETGEIVDQVGHLPYIMPNLGSVPNIS